jgi:hypothetical protein
MRNSVPGTIAAVFDNRGRAETAIDELSHAGFDDDQIGFVLPGGTVKEATTATSEAEERGAKGAVAGAVTGGVTGAVAGALVAGLIPGVGAVLAGGILTGMLLGGAAGAAGGSYLGPFIALGFHEEEARHYERELKAGRTIVVVKAGDRANEAIQILHNHGGREARLPDALAGASR